MRAFHLQESASNRSVPKNSARPRPNFFKAFALTALLALSACGKGDGSGSGGGSPPSRAVTGSHTGVASATGKNSMVRKAEVKAPTPASPCSVGYWGDSISALTEPLMDDRLDISLHAVPGGTAKAAQETFLQDALAERFIVIQYGMNDANGQVPVEATLRSMLDRVKAKGRTPVLTGISRASAGEVMLRVAYNVQIAGLATEYSALHADWPGLPFNAAADLMDDGVHPNDGYQQRLADKLSETILAVAPECAVDPE